MNKAKHMQRENGMEAESSYSGRQRGSAAIPSQVYQHLQNKNKSEVKTVMGESLRSARTLMKTGRKGLHLLKPGSIGGLVLMAALIMVVACGWPRTAGAATYYVNAQSGQSVGADGSTNMTTLADLSVTGGASNQNRASMSATAPNGSSRYRISEGSTDTRTGQEFFRAYTPKYAAATTISANATAYADFYMRSTGSSVTAKATLYEYNDSTGIVGSAKGTASYTGSASSSSRQTMNNVSFGNSSFTVASGNRLLVIFSFDMSNSRPAYLWGQGSSSTPSGYQNITVTETGGPCTANAPTLTITPATQTIATNGGTTS